MLSSPTALAAPCSEDELTPSAELRGGKTSYRSNLQSTPPSVTGYLLPTFMRSTLDADLSPHSIHAVAPAVFCCLLDKLNLSEGYTALSCFMAERIASGTTLPEFHNQHSPMQSQKKAAPPSSRLREYMVQQTQGINRSSCSCNREAVGVLPGWTAQSLGVHTTTFTLQESAQVLPRRHMVRLRSCSIISVANSPPHLPSNITPDTPKSGSPTVTGEE